MDHDTLWKECLKGVMEHVSPQHFSTWFRPIKVADSSEETLTLEAPNRFFHEWIREHYELLIQEILRRISGREIQLLWKVKEDEPVSGARKTANKEQKPSKARKSVSSSSSLSSPTSPPSPSLNQRYTFDTFVVGKANDFAHAACYAVANHLASKYNPLFIYGGVGLGKTHLLQAIGHKVLQNTPSAKVYYYTSERFMNNFINYVSRQKMADFRGRFRNVDVLLIDDIQFWAGKERTQEEFFHTFNALYENHKQIVVTSDKFPKDIDGLEERLRSRFAWGLVADIQPPDTETKIAILKSKTSIEGFSLPDDVAAWLASVSGSNIRELEGYLNRILAVSSLTNQEITLTMSKEALKNLLREKEERLLTMEEIQRVVSGFYNIKSSDLRSKRRHRTVALPRQVAMFLARKYGGFSFPEIGAAFGGKDHSTAIHAVKKIEKGIKENTELKNTVKSIEVLLGVG